MDSLRVFKFDGGCTATKINGAQVPEVLQTNNCSECVYSEHRSTCVMRIFDILTQKTQGNMTAYLKLTDDIAHEELESHPNLIKSLK